MSAPIYAPLTTPPRDAVLAAVLASARPFDAPADRGLAELVSQFALTPAVSAKVLRAAGSCAGGLTPAEAREFWTTAISGAVIARELAVLANGANPDDDLAAALLRDLGELLLRKMDPGAWAEHVTRHGDRLLEDPCGAEAESFGVGHADVGAELLARCELPADIAAAVRDHHDPERAAPGPRRDRAERLHFANLLAQIDAVAQNADLLARVLATARDRFQLSREALVGFLQRVAPKVESLTAAFARETSLPRPSRAGIAPPSAAPRPSRAPASSALPEYRPEFVAKFPEGGCRLGTYELRGLLGRGAVGVVFRAFDTELGRTAAVKVLAPELAASAPTRERFARETQSAAVIRHENVVGIYSVSEAAGTPYLALEYVYGRTLEARTEQHGPAPVLLLVSTARQIAAGLAAAHAEWVLHRDLTPASVLLDEETGQVKLTDFGMARVLDDGSATDGSRAGSPFYTAPEVIAGGPVTARSDLYALGCVMYTMATGRVPFPGQTTAAVYRAACEIEPTPPGAWRANLPDWLDEMILCLLRKDPAARYPDAGSVAAILGECC